MLCNLVKKTKKLNLTQEKKKPTIIYSSHHFCMSKAMGINACFKACIVIDKANANSVWYTAVTTTNLLLYIETKLSMRECPGRTNGFQTSQTPQLITYHKLILQNYVVSKMIWCPAEDINV